MGGPGGAPWLHDLLGSAPSTSGWSYRTSWVVLGVSSGDPIGPPGRSWWTFRLVQEDHSGGPGSGRGAKEHPQDLPRPGLRVVVEGWDHSEVPCQLSLSQGSLASSTQYISDAEHNGSFINKISTKLLTKGALGQNKMQGAKESINGPPFRHRQNGWRAQIGRAHV